MQLLVCAMGPPGGGRNNITGRFTRHLNVISIESFDDTAMTKIFSALADWHFSKGFDAIFGRLGKVNDCTVHINFTEKERGRGRGRERESVVLPQSSPLGDGPSYHGGVQISGGQLSPDSFQISLRLQPS